MFIKKYSYTLTFILLQFSVNLLAVSSNPSDIKPSIIADDVYRNGYIYTVDGFSSVAEAVAIKDGEFVAVGSNEFISEFIGNKTKVHNLREKMVMPGIVDVHVHPLRGALAKYNFCSFSEDLSMDDMLGAVQSCLKNKKQGEWLQGSKWNSNWVNDIDKSILDKIAPNNPVYLIDDTNHIAWVNSRALALAGITKDTPDPENGIIDRDPKSGEPTGILKESASGLVLNVLPPPSQDMLIKSAKWVFEKLNSYGVTSFQAAQLDRNRLTAYRTMEDKGELTVRMKANWDYNTRYADAPRDEMLKRFDTREERGDRTELINPDGVKIYVDGVWMGYASPYFDPYEGTHNHGSSNIDLPNLSSAVTELDSIGLSIMMHAVGDVAVRNAIDAVAAARKTNGSNGPRHLLAHTYSVHPDDKGRGNNLNIAFEISPPSLWYPSSLSRAAGKLIGRKRLNEAIPARTMLEAGDVICYGSDWDNVPEPDPWLALEALITRQAPGFPEKGSVGRQEAIDIHRAIKVMTYNGAYALSIDDKAGSIEVGKKADMIILNQRLLHIPVRDIHKTKVIKTLLNGRVVFNR